MYKNLEEDGIDKLEPKFYKENMIVSFEVVSEIVSEILSDFIRKGRKEYCSVLSIDVVAISYIGSHMFVLKYVVNGLSQRDF